MSPLVEENSGLQADGSYESTDATEDGIAEENGSVGTYQPTGVQGSVAIATKPSESKPAPKRLDEQLNIEGKVFLVTGGGQGLGLAMAEGLGEAGGIVYCLDWREEPHPDFFAAQKAIKSFPGKPSHGSLQYRHVDVRDTEGLERITSEIASLHKRIDGLVAAAAIQQVTPATQYSVKDICRMVDINFTGAFMSAAAVAKRMMEYHCKGSIVFVASMSGFVANKGLLSPVYNSSKAALIQLARNLAMEWGKHGIRVNSLCPGHVITPMVQANFKEDPGLQEKWEEESMLGRIAMPDEFKGPALYLCSPASSYMTGSAMIVDGGHTAW